MEQYLTYLLLTSPYWLLFVFSLIYFLFLYFVLGYIFESICKYLEKKNMVSKISQEEINVDQTKFEIKHSLVSITLFAFSGIWMAFLLRNNYYALAKNDIGQTIIGLLVLNAWNEIHFFAVHRLMHLRYFFKHFHIIHHKSKTPSVKSVYSFHWLEALLLSTVQISIAWLIPLNLYAIIFYPLNSILFNFAGHCNYRFGNGKLNVWVQLSTRHSTHHQKSNFHLGFVTPLLDIIQNKFKKQHK